MKQALLHHYRYFRAAGYTASAAFTSARSHMYFLSQLRADAAEHKRRSRAAKKAWKRRKAEA